MLKRFIFILLSIVGTVFAQANHALEFNGIDAQIDISTKPLLKQWTLSAWIYKKGSWAKDEVIIGNGWVTVDEWEDYPLHFHQGKLCCYRTGVFAPKKMPQGWHHIAASWDGKSTRLFIDGLKVAEKNGGRPICPSFIGSDDGKEFFRGKLDEVCIWSKALNEAQIKQLMADGARSSHSDYASLVAYYKFDDKAVDATDYKGNHKADIKKYYKSRLRDGGPKYVLNDNDAFVPSEMKMLVLAAEQLKTSFPVKAGTSKVEVLKLKVRTEGVREPLAIDSFDLDLSGCSNLDDIETVTIYALGANAEVIASKKLLSFKPSALISVKLGQLKLKQGVNYIAVSCDLKDTAAAGNVLEVNCPNLVIGGVVRKTLNVLPVSPIRIISSKRDVNKLKVLNWNIWHGGIEKGKNLGPKQIVEIIQRSDADVITMVETYGSGKRIAEMLGFHFYQPYKRANVSVLSRYPIVKTYTSNKGNFFSTGAKVKLANGREALIWTVWVRYWGADYTLQQYSKKYTAEDWIAGDRETAQADIKAILEKDIATFYDGKIPLIFAGDFNSCSHLDMTKRAGEAGLHNGWTVDLPAHKQLLEKGFKDSFREVHPDESKNHGGTWAANYRWCDDFRIDYIYYKGIGIKAVDSRVISNHPEADVLWPGDHSAVLSTFDVNGK